MTRFPTPFVLTVLACVALPLAAMAVVESKTGTEYPDEITVETAGGSAELKATGVGLREKTFMKVDVYTIVSYIPADATLAGEAKEAGLALIALDAPKRIQMDLRRGFSREKLINAFVDVIKKNYEDTSAIDDDMATFSAYFTRDAEEGDLIVFDYCPQKGLTTILNGEVTGVIENFAFTRALWTVWFGEKPANKGLREDLLAEVLE